MDLKIYKLRYAGTSVPVVELNSSRLPRILALGEQDSRKIEPHISKHRNRHIDFVCRRPSPLPTSRSFLA
jgi:hypothetical protein